MYKGQLNYMYLMIVMLIDNRVSKGTGKSIHGQQINCTFSIDSLYKYKNSR